MSEEYLKPKDVSLDELIEFINSSFGIACNANDFFGYATANMVMIDPLDLKWVMPIFKKYKWDGINAVMSYIAEQKPLKDYQTKEFKAAYKEIKKMKPVVWSEY